jgi:hypothetical protein
VARRRCHRLRRGRRADGPGGGGADEEEAEEDMQREEEQYGEEDDRTDAEDDAAEGHREEALPGVGPWSYRAALFVS